jgi:hypothetical protein
MGRKLIGTHVTARWISFWAYILCAVLLSDRAWVKQDEAKTLG